MRNRPDGEDDGEVDEEPQGGRQWHIIHVAKEFHVPKVNAKADEPEEAEWFPFQHTRQQPRSVQTSEEKHRPKQSAPGRVPLFSEEWLLRKYELI
jgi:hypothetical protein